MHNQPVNPVQTAGAVPSTDTIGGCLDALMCRIRELETHNSVLSKVLEKVSGHMAADPPHDDSAYNDGLMPRFNQILDELGNQLSVTESLTRDLSDRM